MWITSALTRDVQRITHALTMAKIPQQTIDQILGALDIVDVVGDYVALKKTGANFKACCPFHAEKTASFVVSPDKQIFHCFGCGVGGNALGFVMKIEKSDFRDAIEKLGARAGIEIKSLESSDPQESIKTRLYKINAYAQWLFADAIKNQKSVLDYLKNRGLSLEIIEKFELGFAPNDFETLVGYFAKKQIPVEDAGRLGLVKSKSAGHYYSFFRNRLMFPIRDAKARLIGFGARSLSKDDEPKYLNSPESPIYNKSFELYGLNFARPQIMQTSQVFLVEGYIDVIACHQLGLVNTVAPLGTSLTEPQVQYLKKYAKNIVLMFDGDAAGLKAILRSIEICLKLGVHPQVVILPEALDPGDFLLHAEGKEKLLALTNKAQHAMDFILSRHTQTIPTSPHERTQVIKELKNWFDKLADPTERNLYYKSLSRYFEVTLPSSQKNVDIAKESDSVSSLKTNEGSLEFRLVAYAVKHPGDLERYSLEKLCEDFENQALKDLSRLIFEFFKKHETFNANLAIHRVPEEHHGMFSKIMMLSEDEDTTTTFGQSLKKYLVQKNKKRLKAITEQIYRAEIAKDSGEKHRLLVEKQKLIRESSDLVEKKLS